METLESRQLLAGVPFGALPNDTGEYLLGKVVVTPIFLESNGAIDPSTEDWSAQEIADTKAKIQEAMQWWTDALAALGTAHSLQFVYDFQYADQPVEVPYEPISRTSNDYTLWVDSFLDSTGFKTGAGVQADMQTFNSEQRLAADANWAYTLFVVDSELDPDHRFAAGGSFSQSFTFPGGRFSVLLSTRPASIFAHEMGHNFWARDEYAGGGSYTDHRGYYDSFNLNAADNPAPGFVQQPSLMAAGVVLDDGWQNHLLSDSAMALVGWLDSDGDGVFDVLDVPNTLSGTGYFNSSTQQYHFLGEAAVGTLPNRNPSGLRSDITINQIDEIEYRIDAGPWQTAAAVGQYQADLDITISGVTGIQIQLRAISRDAGTGQVVATSPVFTQTVLDPVVVGGDAAFAGGVVFADANKNGHQDPGESGIGGLTVRLVNAQQQPIVEQGVEPDDFADAADLRTVNPAVTLSAIGTALTDNTVLSWTRPSASTGDQVFGFFLAPQQVSTDWLDNSREFVATFTTPVSRVSLDAIANSDGDVGRLEAYDASGNLLFRYQTSELVNGAFETMTVVRGAADIASIRAYGHAASAVYLDHLRFGPEVVTTTDALGGYQLAGMQAGTFRVTATPPAGSSIAAPGVKSIILSDGQSRADVDFAVVQGLGWTNSPNRYDVNNDGSVDLQDLLALLGDQILNGPRTLPPGGSGPPFLDVDGDGNALIGDLVLVLQEILLSANGEGEAGLRGGGAAAPSGGTGSGNSSGSGSSGGSGLYAPPTPEGENAPSGGAFSTGGATRRLDPQAVDSYWDQWDGAIPALSSNAGGGSVGGGLVLVDADTDGEVEDEPPCCCGGCQQCLDESD